MSAKIAVYIACFVLSAISTCQFGGMIRKQYFNNRTMPALIKEAWECIGVNATILDWISDGVPLQFKCPLPNCAYSNVIKNKREADFVSAEIGKLLNSGAVRKVPELEVSCILPLKCVPKKQNKLRLVLDCRHVNKYIECPTFSQEGIDSVADQIEDGGELITIDLKNGFHYVPVKRRYQKYLGFKWKGECFVWCVLAFGIKSAPYYFNKILRPIVSFLRGQHIRNTVFVDDFLVMMRKMCCTDHKEFVLQVLNELGWTINVKKSKLLPSQSCDFIGYIVNSVGKNGPWLQVTHKKLHKLRRHIRTALKLEIVPVRFIAKITGACIAMTKAILPAKLFLCNVYRLIASRTSWNDKLFLDTDSRKDLHWWLDALSSWNGAPLRRKDPLFREETDASGTGWGGAWGERAASGTWTKDVSFQPSNFRELLAILKTILSYLEDLKGKSVQILSDNVTAVAYVNKLGGSSKTMSALMRTIFTVVQENQIDLSAKFLAGKLNVQADRRSRILSPYEWKLHPRIFLMLENLWGPHSINRFASEMMTQLPRYNSLFADLDTEAVDCMTQDWSKDNNFINPPFWMLNKVVRKIKEDHAEATVIAPYWKAQPWFQEIQKMCVAVPLRIRICNRMMLKRGGIPEPMKNPRWKLFAWRISGDKSYQRVIGQKQQ